MNVFIDGSAGTTGLRIQQRLSQRQDVTLMALPEEKRKDAAARSEMLNTADVVFLCLPDDAAREAVGMVQNSKVKVIDASTAHRTLPGWNYGLPELSAQHRAALQTSTRTAVPGCHAGGFVTLVYPLVAAGILPKEALLTDTSLTGYSGGGKKMIAEYEAPGRDKALDAPRPYGTTQMHKHLPEMQKITGLATPPVFIPIVADFYAGMLVTVPLFAGQLAKPHTVEALRAFYADYYAGQPMLTVAPQMDAFLPANTMAGRDSLEIIVGGNDERILLCARFDNLGKGASGAALQCMNIMMGLDETTGLVL